MFELSSGVKPMRKSLTRLMNELIKIVFVEQPPDFAWSAKYRKEKVAMWAFLQPLWNYLYLTKASISESSGGTAISTDIWMNGRTDITDNHVSTIGELGSVHI